MTLEIISLRYSHLRLNPGFKEGRKQKKKTKTKQEIKGRQKEEGKQMEKVSFPLCLIKHHPMKMYGSVEVQSKQF